MHAISFSRLHCIPFRGSISHTAPEISKLKGCIILLLPFSGYRFPTCSGPFYVCNSDIFDIYIFLDKETLGELRKRVMSFLNRGSRVRIIRSDSGETFTLFEGRNSKCYLR